MKSLFWQHFSITIMFYEYELSMKNKQYFFPLAYFFFERHLN